MTSGKALRELLPKLKAAANVEIAGMFSIYKPLRKIAQGLYF